MAQPAVGMLAEAAVVERRDFAEDMGPLRSEPMAGQVPLAALAAFAELGIAAAGTLRPRASPISSIAHPWPDILASSARRP